MIKVVKRCEFPMADGFKCNKVFSVSSARTSRKYCDSHVGNNVRTAESHSDNKLVRSSNAYAQEGNNEQMREWIMTKMRQEKKEIKRLAKIERELSRLENIFEKSESNSKKIDISLNKILGEKAFSSKIEGIVVKLLRKTNMKVSDMDNDLSFIKARLDSLENKNGEEEE